MIACRLQAVLQPGPLIFSSMLIHQSGGITPRLSSWNRPPRPQPCNEPPARHAPWTTWKPGSSRGRARWRAKWATKMQVASRQWRPEGIKVFCLRSPLCSNLVRFRDYRPRSTLLTTSLRMPRRWQILSSISWMNRWTWSKSSLTRIVTSETNYAVSVGKRLSSLKTLSTIVSKKRLR